MFTINFHFTKFYYSFFRITHFFWQISFPGVVVDYVAALNFTIQGYGWGNGRYIISCIVETQDSIFFDRRIWYVHGETQECADFECVSCLYKRKIIKCSTVYMLLLQTCQHLMWKINPHYWFFVPKHDIKVHIIYMIDNTWYVIENNIRKVYLKSYIIMWKNIYFVSIWYVRKSAFELCTSTL